MPSRLGDTFTKKGSVIGPGGSYMNIEIWIELQKQFASMWRRRFDSPSLMTAPSPFPKFPQVFPRFPTISQHFFPSVSAFELSPCVVVPPVVGIGVRGAWPGGLPPRARLKHLCLPHVDPSPLLGDRLRSYVSVAGLSEGWDFAMSATSRS